jgi:hypothetical protein
MPPFAAMGALDGIAATPLNASMVLMLTMAPPSPCRRIWRTVA